MNNDLPARLRLYAPALESLAPFPQAADLGEAAAEIERLRGERESLIAQREAILYECQLAREEVRACHDRR